MVRHMIAAGLVASSLTCSTIGTAQAGDHTGAVIGGFAAGAVGGALLGAALSQPRPAPVYVAPPPPPPPATVYVQPVAESPYDGQFMNLHAACDAGDRHACIRFGVLIGQHRERMAEWRRMHPDYFAY
jgi:hypothetical protein